MRMAIDVFGLLWSRFKMAGDDRWRGGGRKGEGAGREQGGGGGEGRKGGAGGIKGRLERFSLLDVTILKPGLHRTYYFVSRVN